MVSTVCKLQKKNKKQATVGLYSKWHSLNPSKDLKSTIVFIISFYMIALESNNEIHLLYNFHFFFFLLFDLVFLLRPSYQSWISKRKLNRWMSDFCWILVNTTLRKWKARLSKVLWTMRPRVTYHLNHLSIVYAVLRVLIPDYLYQS